VGSSGLLGNLIKIGFTIWNTIRDTFDEAIDALDDSLFSAADNSATLPTIVGGSGTPSDPYRLSPRIVTGPQGPQASTSRGTLGPWVSVTSAGGYNRWLSQGRPTTFISARTAADDIRASRALRSNPLTYNELLIGSFGIEPGSQLAEDLAFYNAEIYVTVAAAGIGKAAKSLTVTAAKEAAVAGQVTLREGEALLAVVKDGKIIAQTSDMLLGHGQFVARTLGTLPQGAEVVTISKLNGQVVALSSMTFRGTQGFASEAAQAAAQAVFR
jgi:hypothetical protein